MGSVAMKLRRRRVGGGGAASRLADGDPGGLLVASAACALWTIAVMAPLVGDAGVLESVQRPLTFGVPAVAAGVLAALSTSPRWLVLVLWWTALLAGAQVAVLYLDTPVLAAAPGLVALAALVVARAPAATIGVVFALGSAFASLELLLKVPVGPLGDLLLSALWAVLVWRVLVARGAHRAVIPLALVPLVAYIAISAVYALVSDPLVTGLYSFRMSCWYMGLVPLVPYVLRGEETLRTAWRACLVVAAAAAAYAVFRWIVGPAAVEEEAALQGGAYVTGDEGELRLVGASGSPTALGIWASVVGTWALALAMSPIGRWRWIAALTAALSVVAMLGANTRVAFVAVGCGALVALALAAVARGFRGRRALPVVLGVVGLACGGGVLVGQMEGTGKEAQRLRGLLNPGNDSSVRGRVVKWQTVFREAEKQPFGHGLGTSGAAEGRYARFKTPASYDPDSSYLKVAWDQGLLVLGLFITAILFMIAWLARGAVAATDPEAGALAVAACSALAAFAVAISFGVYIEGIKAAVPWVIVGLGFAGLVRRPTRRSAT